MDELGGSGGEADHFRIAERGSGAGEAGNHEPVPSGDDFVIEMRARAFRASGEEGRDAPVDDRFDLLGRFLEVLRRLLEGHGTEEGVEALEFAVGIAFRTRIAVATGAVGVAEDAAVFLAEKLVDLGGLPDVEGAFRFVIGIRGREAVGVFSGEETAVLMEHVAFEIGHCVAHDRFKEDILRDLPGLRVGGEELRLIVEHLFVMRDVPVAIHAVAVEAAADVIAHAAVRHAAQGFGGHFHGPIALGLAGFVLLLSEATVNAHEQVEPRGARELRCAAKAALVVIEGAGEVVVGFLQNRIGLDAGDFFVLVVEVLLQLLDRTGGAVVDALAIFRPHFAQLVQQVLESDAPWGVFRRIVSAAVERLQLRREEDAHRPAAVPARRLDVSHVGEIDVGPLLAIDFDGDEVVVDDFRDVFVLKRLTLHDVAPVAGRVAGGEEDWFVLLLRELERLLAPRQPVHGIVRVLEQVGRALLGEGVGKFVGGGSRVAHGGGRS